MGPRCSLPLGGEVICNLKMGHPGRHRIVSLKGRETQRVYQASPEGRVQQKVWRESPGGHAASKAYTESPEGHRARGVYKTSPKGRAVNKAYHESPKGRDTKKAYNESPEGREMAKAYYASPQGRAVKKAYNESPKGRVANKIGLHKRRALELASPIEPFTAKELAAHVEVMGGRCVYCNGPYEHLDHVYPLSKGGPHALSNLVPACAPCNMRKHNMLPLHFLFPLQFTSNAP